MGNDCDPATNAYINFEAKPSELDFYFRLRLVVVEYVLIAVGPSVLFTLLEPLSCHIGPLQLEGALKVRFY